MLETPAGVGVLRRLPATRAPATVEVTWLPAAGAPPDFREAARRLTSAAGITPVWCALAEPSPGLRLVAAYLREGRRLREEGIAPGSVDGVLRRWGMMLGPFALGARLGAGWERRLRSLESERVAPTLSGAPDPGWPADRAAEADRMVEETVSALVLEMARLWEFVDEPREAGWAVLDMFVLGGPLYRGGVLGAARSIGEGRVFARLEGLAARRGPAYHPGDLLEAGLLGSLPGIPGR